MIDIFKILGIIGLLSITFGILNKKRKTQDYLCIIGGILLIIYSININDIIFILLESIFTISAVYDLIKTIKRRN